MIIGKVENITHKISKKNNRKFAILTIMDFHGSVELMIFDDHVKALEGMNLEEPVVITINVSKTEQFTRINARKILTLDEAKKQKVDIRKEKPKEPELAPLKLKGVRVTINIDKDVSILDKIKELAIGLPGNNKLVLEIVGKEERVEIDTQLFVSDEFEKRLFAIAASQSDGNAA